jgi:hypothetical protein
MMEAVNYAYLYNHESLLQPVVVCYVLLGDAQIAEWLW